jgi:LPPG:FO 2-phospho-L-lactate transferase
VRGIADCIAAPGVLEAISTAELIVLCPSNPFVSIGPILQVAGMLEAVQAARARGAVVAGVSPIIGGSTVKGPAARMLVELGHAPSAAGVAAIYREFLDLFVIDTQDAALAGEIDALGVRPVVTDALMRHRRGEARLARVLLQAVRRAAV